MLKRRYQKNDTGSNVNMKINHAVPVIFFMINDRPDLKTARLKIPKNF